MSVIADLVRAGVDPDLIDRVSAELQTAYARGRDDAPSQRTARQERNARYYDRKASERRLNASEQDDLDASIPSPLPPKENPHTPKEITPITPPPSSSLRSDETRGRSQDLRFEFEREFWPAYPHKVGKPAALRAFGAARKTRPLETILAGLDRYKLDKPDERSWLNPATFLNQQRFLDQPARAGPSAGAPPRGRTFAEIARGDCFDDPGTDHTSQDPGASAERSKIPGFAGPLSERDRGDAAGPLFDL